MNAPKRHHTTPRFILRNFADESGKFYVYDKRREHPAVEYDSIDNRFVIKHQNSIKTNDGGRDHSLEEFYSRAEDTAAPVVRKILGAVRSRQTPNLSASEKLAWNTFVICQWSRVPDNRQRLYSIEKFGELVWSLVDEFERETGQKATTQEMEALSDRDHIKRLYERALFEALQKEKTEPLACLQRRGLGIFAIYDHRRSIVIGENTVFKTGPADTSYLGDPRVELWFPIAPDVAVTPCGNANEERLTELTNYQKLRDFNAVIFENSSLVGSRSRRLLEALAKGLPNSTR